jgi:hypothetical protein
MSALSAREYRGLDGGRSRAEGRMRLMPFDRYASASALLPGRTGPAATIACRSVL